MFLEEINQYRDKKPGVMNRFILIWRVCFLVHDDFRVFIQEILVIERDIPDDTKTIGDHAKFKHVAEMTVDIELLDVRIG